MKYKLNSLKTILNIKERGIGFIKLCYILVSPTHSSVLRVKQTNPRTKVTLLIFSLLGEMSGRLLLVGHGSAQYGLQVQLDLIFAKEHGLAYCN